MRIAHTMLRVRDLERSLDFYQNILGMRLLRKKEYPGGAFTLAFVGYSDEEQSHCLELTYNWDGRSYDLGTGYGHIAIESEDIYTLCRTIEEKGGVLARPPGPMKHGSTHIAFVKDPDGYSIELIQRSH